MDKGDIEHWQRYPATEMSVFIVVYAIVIELVSALNKMYKRY